MRYHFDPTNVTAGELGLAVEAGTGPGVAEHLARAPIDLSVFDSKGRVAYVYFDLARAWAQADGPRDAQALRALDAADQLALVRLRHDPIARDLVLTLDQRAPQRTWELDSLRRRFGLDGACLTECKGPMSISLHRLPGDHNAARWQLAPGMVRPAALLPHR